LSFLPLTLGVGQASGAEGGSLGLPSKSKAEKTLKRDGFSCRFCGFSSPQYQRVIPFKDEFVTVCSFCEQVLFLERAGMMGSGVLIWLPEVTQAELNHIARAIYVAREDEDGKMAAAATRALDALLSRKIDAKKRLGSEDPLLLSSVLSEHLTDKERSAAIRKLEGIRLLPLDKYIVRIRGSETNVFPRIVKFWRSEKGPFAKLPTDAWQKLFAKIPA
jgi:intracellular multiplication protein IcmJ